MEEEEEKETHSKEGRITKNVLRPTETYEDSPLLKFQKQFSGKEKEEDEAAIKKEYSLRDVYDWIRLEYNEL